ncbi:DUF6894 family protein [Bradyrhizobium sp. DASA03076]|uniref:DUF6894 family protein n=1 Tax=Bradyrhizobium TaxID=374 RepID=UPI000AE82054
MPRYFFREHVRGQTTEDPQGTQFRDDSEACHQAVLRMPANLKKAEKRSHDTHVATEVTNGNRTLFVVRGKVVVERR